MITTGDISLDAHRWTETSPGARSLRNDPSPIYLDRTRHLTDGRVGEILRLCRFKMAREKQLAFDLPTWGGPRRGAGRKPKAIRAGVAHLARPTLSKHHPVHVTWRMMPHVWNLRSRRSFRQLSDAFAAGCDRPGFRLIHFSVQGNHLHLVVEASDAMRLSRGLQGLAVRIARRLNRLMGRAGKVFADRYHAHVLRSPAEVARAVGYVLGNFVVHALRRGDHVASAVPDEYSSARRTATGPPVVAAAKSWLLRVGWRRGIRSGTRSPVRVPENICDPPRMQLLGE
jgi:REP-associated tyrosine transposase